jgi:putative serine protease PepD
VVPPPPSPYEPPRPADAYGAPKPAPYETPSVYEAPSPYSAPRSAYGAEQPGQGQPGQSPSPEQGGTPALPASAPSTDPFAAPTDPYAVPATPAYAATPGFEGPAGPGGPGDGSGEGPGGPGSWGAFPSASTEGRGPKRRSAALLIAAVAVAALVAGGVGGAIGYNEAKGNNNSTSSTTVSAPKSSAALNRAPTSVAGIASKSLPSVVTIEASGSTESGTGTGFVYDTQGHILTNNHVVAPAANGGTLTVTFSDGKKYDAEVVGRAQGYDVAVIKLKNPSGATLTPLTLGNSDDAAVGDATIAIGAPFGLSGTVTTGIVSAVHRPVASSDSTGSSSSYMSAIQTDASINPGNSGGPLLDANGAVIGINSAIQPTTSSTDPTAQSGSIGLGFAIPINQAKRVADQLIQTGKPIYPVIGVSLDTQYTGDGAKIATDSGAVTSGGPGDKAGLQSGDVITKFDGTIIDSGQTLIAEIWQDQPGDKVSVTYTRSGSTHTATVTLGSRVGDS